MENDGFLLADDLGTGKTVTVCAALHQHVSIGDVRRALVVCLEAAKGQWARCLTEWAPGLVTVQVEGDASARSHAWNSAAHVTLVDYATLSDDIRTRRLAGPGLEWDLVVLDDALAYRRRAIQPIPEYERLRVPRRWALSSVMPQRAEDWLSIFLFITPGTARGGSATLPDLERRFSPYTLHRSKTDLAGQLPPLTRDRIWVTLDRKQRVPYWEILEEERQRLDELGQAVTRAHVEKAVARLKQACNFAPASLDGAKIGPMVDLAEDVAAAGSKMVVFTQFRQDSLDRLHRVLEAFGALRLDSVSSPAEQSQTLRRFQDDTRWHVLLADFDLRPESGSLPGVGTILHFDHRWNPAERRRAEQRLHPDGPASIPLNVYEFWVAGTVDERIDDVLARENLFPEDLPPQIRPAELEDRMTTADWLGRILEIPGLTSG
jgi:SNF2 family DNA or RNA helicase